MRNNYILSEFLANIYSWVFTKIYYPQARLIRCPVYIRGRKSLKIMSKLTTGHHCRFDLPGDKETLYFGNNCEIGDNVHIVAHEYVKIGNNVLVASKVFISDTSHGIYNGVHQSSPTSTPNERDLKTSQVIIGDNVWIGENVVILPGSRIGNGSIVGANAVVQGEVVENTIVVGIPAKAIKKFDFEKKSWERC